MLYAAACPSEGIHNRDDVELPRLEKSQLPSDCDGAAKLTVAGELRVAGKFIVGSAVDSHWHAKMQVPLRKAPSGGPIFPSI